MSISGTKKLVLGRQADLDQKWSEMNDFMSSEEGLEFIRRILAFQLTKDMCLCGEDLQILLRCSHLVRREIETRNLSEVSEP